MLVAIKPIVESSAALWECCLPSCMPEEGSVLRGCLAGMKHQGSYLHLWAELTDHIQNILKIDIKKERKKEKHVM